MDGGIAPSLVEEASGSVKVIEVVLVRLAAPEIDVCDLKIAPEMTSAVAMGLLVVFRSSLIIDQPSHCIIIVYIFWMRGKKFDGLRPQARY